MDIHTQKMYLDPYCTPLKKLSQNKPKPKCKYQSYKRSREKHRRKYLFPWIRQRFLGYNSKNVLHKNKVGKLDFIRIKNLLYKDAAKKMKGQYTKLEKYWQTIHTINYLYPEYVKTVQMQF